MTNRTLFLFAACLGIGLRSYMLLSPLGALDSDEAVVGLMTIRLLEGEFSVFFWGQPYAGTIDVLLTVVPVALFGAGTFVIKAVPLLLSVAAAGLVFLIGIESVGRRAAAFGAAIFWTWPAYFVWWSTKTTGGHYWPLLVLTLTLVVLLLRGHRTNELSAARAAGMGVLFGLAWWAGPQVVYLALPIGLYVLLTNTKLIRWKAVVSALTGAAIGALPWIYQNARTSFASLQSPWVPEIDYLDRLAGFLTSALPGSLGLKTHFTNAWVGGWAGLVIFSTALCGCAILLLKRPKETRPLLAVLLSYPFLFAISPFYYVSVPQYLLYLAPVTSLLIGWVVVRWRAELVMPLALTVTTALTVIGIAVMRIEKEYWMKAPDVRTPLDLEPLLTTLKANQIDAVFADYWIANRILFFSEERIKATSIFTTRRPSYFRAVSNDERPAYVVVRGSSEGPMLERRLGLAGVRYRKFSAGGFLIILPETKVLPRELPP